MARTNPIEVNEIPHEIIVLLGRWSRFTHYLHNRVVPFGEGPQLILVINLRYDPWVGPITVAYMPVLSCLSSKADIKPGELRLTIVELIEAK